MSSLSINTSRFMDAEKPVYEEELDSPRSSRSQSFIELPDSERITGVFQDYVNDDEYPEIPKTQIYTEEEISRAEAILSGKDVPEVDIEETQLDEVPMSLTEKRCYSAIAAFLLFFISLILLAVLL